LNPTFDAFAIPGDTMKGCFDSHKGHGFSCYFDSLAGAAWDQRGKQYLLANGVAVVMANPWKQDEWDYPSSEDVSAWETGYDRPFLLETFAQMKAGTFGPLDTSNVIFHGFSGGAQMVGLFVCVTLINMS
jgi:hypothetical protein